MSQIPQAVRFELGPDPEDIVPAMAALARFCEENQIPSSAAQAAELALDELLTNCVSHGQLDPGQGCVAVELSLLEGAMEITIRDNGIAFDPFSQAEPDLESPLEERQIGGVGIHLVKNFMDSWSYRRDGDYNLVTLRKNL